jgi:hypothetical protein
MLNCEDPLYLHNHILEGFIATQDDPSSLHEWLNAYDTVDRMRTNTGDRTAGIDQVVRDRSPRRGLTACSPISGSP